VLQNNAESELVHEDDKWLEYEKQIQWMIEYHIFSRHPHNDIHRQKFSFNTTLK